MRYRPLDIEVDMKNESKKFIILFILLLMAGCITQVNHLGFENVTSGTQLTETVPFQPKASATIRSTLTKKILRPHLLSQTMHLTLKRQQSHHCPRCLKLKQRIPFCNYSLLLINVNYHVSLD